MVVLDAIHDIQAKQEPTLAVRWNCKAGRCGSCSAEINGKPRLMCMTRMTHFPEGEPITVTPMRVVPGHQGSGDRRVATTSRWRRRSRRSSRARATPTARGGCSRRTSIASRSSGSASSASSARTCATSSATTRRRTSRGRASSSTWRGSTCTRSTRSTGASSSRTSSRSACCNITKCCTEVCPERIHITDNGIIPLKERVADDYFDPVRWAR